MRSVEEIVKAISNCHINLLNSALNENDCVFANIENGLNFSLLFERQLPVNADELIFDDTLIYKVNDIKDISEILLKLKVQKENTEEILYRMFKQFNGVEGTPFYVRFEMQKLICIKRKF